MILNNKNLYHFTSVDTLTKYILKDNRLKFNNLYEMNDPKESNSWPFKVYDESDAKSYLKINIQLFEDIDRYIKTHWLIACFKEEFGIIVNTDINDCSRAYFDMRMWAQYGENHAGVCVIFDYEKLVSSFSNANDINIFNGCASYLQNYINGNEDPFALSFYQMSQFGLNEMLNRQTEKYYKEFFFTKSLSWSGEREYRIALQSKDKEVEFYLHDFKDAISGIILGNKTSEEDQKVIFDTYGKQYSIYRILSNNWHNEIVKVEDARDNTISLNGISFSTQIPANYFVVKAQNTKNDTVLILINYKGEVILLPSNN